MRFEPWEQKPFTEDDKWSEFKLDSLPRIGRQEGGLEGFTFHLLGGQVKLQWKNPDFLLRNPDFLLKHVDLIIKQSCEDTGGVPAPGHNIRPII